MSTPMQHFRKRQLQEYEYERSLNLQTEPTVQIEYPPSPSSLDSGKSTPVETDKTPEKWDGKTSPFKSIECSSNKLDGSEYLQSEPVIASSTVFTNSPLPCTKTHDTVLLNGIHDLSEHHGRSPNSPETSVLDPTALLAIGNKLRQSIEATLSQQNDDSSPAKPKPSTILLAKLHQFKEKSLAKTKQNTATPSSPKQCIADAIYGTIQPVVKKGVLPEGIDNSDDNKTEKLIDPERVLQSNNSIQTGEYIQQELETPPIPFNVIPNERNVYSLEEIHRIANRITGVFDEVYDFEQRIGDFLERGIDIREPEGNHEKIKAINNRPLEPTNINSNFNSKLKTSRTPKKPTTSKTAKFIHVTADTLPEELMESSAVVTESHTSSPNESTMDNSVAQMQKYPFPSAEDPNQMVMGPNGTLISNSALSKIDWSLGAPAITRKILMAIFDRKTLSTHSLTGRPSPAFKDLVKPEKKPLDSAKVADTVYLITSRINATAKEVRMAITTKCADECKMLKWSSRKKLKANMKENTVNKF